jgi:hypothetical protein
VVGRDELKEIVGELEAYVLDGKLSMEQFEAVSTIAEAKNLLEMLEREE